MLPFADLESEGRNWSHMRTPLSPLDELALPLGAPYHARMPISHNKALPMSTSPSRSSLEATLEDSLFIKMVSHFVVVLDRTTTRCYCVEYAWISRSLRLHHCLMVWSFREEILSRLGGITYIWELELATSSISSWLSRA